MGERFVDRSKEIMVALDAPGVGSVGADSGGKRRGGGADINRSTPTRRTRAELAESIIPIAVVDPKGKVVEVPSSKKPNK